MSTASSYAFGPSTYEQERLMLQARILRPYTEMFFRSAGVTSGMRVLELGSGVGDVALLAGEIVGPGGRVLGLDRDPAALERAHRRTAEQGCSSWVSFEATNFDDFLTSEKFDAVVGRYVLLYQSDPASTLRQMIRFLKPGGIVAFHEVDFTSPNPTFPPCEVVDQILALIAEVFRRLGVPPDFGRRLGNTYLNADLPLPTIVAESPVGGERGSHLYAWAASTVVSLAPRLADLGLTLPLGMAADDTLSGKLEAAALANRSQIIASMQFGAWARKPL